MSEPIAWLNPLNDEVFYEGDLIPQYAFDMSGALVYGETCVVLKDPGFTGVVVVKHNGQKREVEYTPMIPQEEIVEWVLPAIEPDEKVFFVGPESPGWRWFYARRATLASRSQSMSSGEDMVV